MFPAKPLWVEIRESFQRWRGYRFGRREILDRDMLSSFPERLESIPSFYERLADKPTIDFSNGYHQAFREVGAKDAEEGRCRSGRYRNHGYNAGWSAEIDRMARQGWRNPNLQKDYELMKELYWERIRTGEHETYFDAVRNRT